MSVAFSAVAPACVERAPSPAAFAPGVAVALALLHPQPPIILRPSHQSAPHRILPYIFELLGKTLLRSQHMIKTLFLPNRPSSSKRPVQAVRGRRFNPL